MRMRPNLEGSVSFRVSRECDAETRFHAELVTAPKGTSALAHHAPFPTVRGGYFFMLPQALAELVIAR